MTKAKARRKRTSVAQKAEILFKLDQGWSRGKVSNHYGISKSAVTNIRKARQKIEATIKSGGGGRAKVVSYTSPTMSLIDDTLLIWHQRAQALAPDLNLSSIALREKALAIRDQLIASGGENLDEKTVKALKDFKASPGWLEGYKRRQAFDQSVGVEKHIRMIQRQCMSACVRFSRC